MNVTISQTGIKEYVLFVNGYDWGPGADKLILNGGTNFSADEIHPEDFEVKITQEIMDWNSMSVKISEGKRKVLSANPVDENGNITKSSQYIALNLEVHPDDPFSNPFVFSPRMVNDWAKVSDYKILNKKLGLEINKRTGRICPLADKFECGKSKTGEISLTYAAYNPPEAQKNKTPVLIWLHGMGEGGTDPYIALMGNRVVNLITPEVQQCFGPQGAIVLVPQTPGFWLMTNGDISDMKNWASNEDTPDVSYYTKALFNLIDEFIKNNPYADVSRIYVGGCSNGGYMTMNMLIEYPEYFAAAYPVCEAYPDFKIDDEKIKKLLKQNIWWTHAQNDKTVIPQNFTVRTFERVKNAGAKNVHFTFAKDVHDTTGNFKDKEGKPVQYNGHWSWIYTLTNQCSENGISIMEWLAKQKK